MGWNLIPELGACLDVVPVSAASSQKDVKPREIVRLQVWVCESKCGRTFVWPGCAPPSLQDSRSNTLSAGLENGWMLLFVPPSSSVKFAGIIGCRAAGTTAAWPPRDCNCRNVMSAYTRSPHCINRRQAGGTRGGGHKSPPPSRLLKPSAKFHFEPVKQTGSITER